MRIVWLSRFYLLKKLAFWHYWHWPRWRPTKGHLMIAILSVLLLIASANLALLWYFQDHFYPQTTVGPVQVGGLTYTQAQQKLAHYLDTTPLTLSFADQAVKLAPAQLGVSYDPSQTLDQVRHHRPLILPMLAWLPIGAQHAPFVYSLNSAKLDQQIQALISQQQASPVNAKLVVNQGKVNVTPEQPGHTYQASQLKQLVLATLPSLPSKPVTIPATTTPATIQASQLQPAIPQVERKLALPIALVHQDNSYQPTASDRSNWLNLDDQSQIQINHDALVAYVAAIAKEIDQPAGTTTITLLDGRQTAKQTGATGQSLDQAAAVEAISQALTANQPLTYQLVVKPVDPAVQYVRTYTPKTPTYQYCVAAKQVDTSLLDQFAATIAQTLADPRGWSLGGKITFHQVQTGCSFTLWLAASSALPQFSSGCSALYSCRVGSSVIINVDPWLHATPAWNSQNGSLADYRSLVINHEVGHWLGFDHWHCGGPGQLAPVMQQQSIDLEGCKINSWPLAGELAQLREMKGL